MDKTTETFLAVAVIGVALGLISYHKSSSLARVYRFKSSMQRKNWQFLAWLGWTVAILDLIIFGFVRALGIM